MLVSTWLERAKYSIKMDGTSTKSMGTRVPAICCKSVRANMAGKKATLKSAWGFDDAFKQTYNAWHDPSHGTTSLLATDSTNLVGCRWDCRMLPPRQQ